VTAERIESPQNPTYRLLLSLLGARGIHREGLALVSGSRPIRETLRDDPRRCRMLVLGGDEMAPPADLPREVRPLRLAPALFRRLDLFGTRSPLLVFEPEPPGRWDPGPPLPAGMTLFLPFQDPENVGGAIRSAVGFAVNRIVLLREAATPFHPKAIRASAGAVLRAPLLSGPSLAELLPAPGMVSLGAGGRDLRSFRFPERAGLVAGLEGPGLPERWRAEALAIRLDGPVESLNAAAAVAIALYHWAGTRNGTAPG
jgi:tRNA G18 (ribose-2'-O)-methylase SpoU